MIGILQHASYEPPGLIEDWLQDVDIPYGIVRLDKGEPLPDWRKIHGLIIMGGPMNVYEDQLYPFLSAEKELIKSMIQHEKKVLGICLGAQLVAHSLGARIRRNSAMEIGWYPVTMFSDLPEQYRSVFPSEFTTFHWHGDMFEFPEGANTIACSDACPSQAFLYKDFVLGIQFHLEMTRDGVDSLIQHCSGDLLSESVFIQCAEELRDGDRNIQSNREILYKLLDLFFLKQV